MINTVDQSSLDPNQQAQQTTSPIVDPNLFASQLAQMLAMNGGQTPGQQASTPPTNPTAVLASQVAQQQAADPNAILVSQIAQIQTNLASQAQANPEQAQALQQSAILQNLNFQASMAMSGHNVPAFMAIESMIGQQMAAMGLASVPQSQDTPAASAAPAASNTTGSVAFTKVATPSVSNASTAASTTAGLSDQIASNASSTSSSTASNASTTSSDSASLNGQIASNAGTVDSGTAAQANSGADVQSLEAELAAFFMNLEAMLSNDPNTPTNPIFKDFNALTAQLNQLQAQTAQTQAATSDAPNSAAASAS